jgi:hypothetical protein
MNRPARFRPSEVTRAVQAVEKAGIAVGVVDIMPDGQIRITARDAGDQRSPLEQWKARRQA